MLNVALEEGYHSMLMGGRHPFGVVSLHMPTDLVDVNVHPSKAEVRFLREREVFGAIRHIVNRAVSAPLLASTGVLAAAADGDDQVAVFQPTLLEVTPSGTDATTTIAPPARALPALRVLGQAGALFIIAEGPDGVYMVESARRA